MAMNASTLSRSGAGFFHLDRRTWKLLCGLDDINAAAAYLTVCAGTGRGSRMSRCSAAAIQNHTGLALKRAKPTITRLIEAGLLSVTASSTANRPAYEVQPFEFVLAATRRGLPRPDLYVVDAVRRRQGRLVKSQQADAERLAMRGLLWQHGETFSADPPAREAKEDFIWLPNGIVTGITGEPSPVKRLRQARNLDALRLLVDLYQAQSLADDGGISRKVMQGGPYRRKLCGTCGNRFVWGFTRQQPYAHAYFGEEATLFFWQRETVSQSTELGLWSALNALLAMGLLVWVPHLVENEDKNSEPIIGIAWNGRGEPLEQSVAVAANAAARRILSEVILDHGADDEDVVVPVWQTMPQVQMLDIFRLRYRPQTQATARWLRQMKESTSEWVRDYEQLGV
jgi:hypothetical protein